MSRGTGLERLLCDNHLLAVAKPAGIATVPDESGDESLLDRARAWVKAEYGKPGDVFLGVVHRLDRPVSGVVLFARTSKAAGRLSDAFRRRAVAKTYFGLGEGTLEGEEGTLEQWLVKDPRRNTVRAFPRGAEPPEGARLAVTRWRLRRREGRRFLLELEPQTGRPHQLRVAAATLGCPLLGDLRYGASEPLSDKSVALHAARLELEHPVRREPVVLATPPPRREWWDAVLGDLR